ncbi:hypothetical protein FRB90_010021 [Tulasnella sp. 427]|nr:hypothetical protein FRB90_010021 [Tulasnella sp. 427]
MPDPGITPGSQPLIHLPNLDTLIIQNIPTPLRRFLYTHIDSISVTCLIADKAESEQFASPNLPLSALVRRCVNATSEVTLTWREADGKFTVGSIPVAKVSNNWIPWASRSAGVELSVDTESGEGVVDVMRALSPLTPPITLHLVGQGTLPEGPGGDNTRRFALDSLGYLSTVKTIRCTASFDAGSVLRYLSVVNQNTCPQLGELELWPWRADEELMAQDVRLFLSARQGTTEETENGGEEEDETPEQTVKKLDKLLIPAGVLERLRATSEDLLAGIEVAHTSAPPTVLPAT